MKKNYDSWTKEEIEMENKWNLPLQEQLHG